jgi:hypothetical protein
MSGVVSSQPARTATRLWFWAMLPSTFGSLAVLGSLIFGLPLP